MEPAHHWRGIEMVETDDKYWECPKCGWAIKFRFNGDRYVSLCPFCKNRLIIEKEEFERDDLEIYFKADF